MWFWAKCNDKKPNDIVFFDFRRIDQGKWYVRMERHSTVNGYLEIKNTAYAASDKYGFDRIVPLDTMAEWAGLPESVAYPGMKQMDFGYYRNPIKNKVDDTACGVSIYDGPAIERIKRADIQGSRLDWEYESGERAVHVDPVSYTHLTLPTIA